MGNFKFILGSVVVLVVVAFVGYWAFFTIESGDTHADKQKQKQLEDRNKELEEIVVKLESEIATLKSEQEIPAEITPVEKPPAPPPTATSSKYQNLINELQKLVDDNVYMKEKSQGTRVGTVQNFLNIYNKTSKKIDNDYGKGTKLDVANFQKAEGLTPDGEAGPSTFKKMIEWLKKQ